ncbi:AMP-dependent synthetase/ligase, partial [Macrophomina phaseolina MS6]
MHAPFRLPAGLDELRFRAAWAATCAAHPTLRARIVLRPQGALLVTTCSPVPIATATVPLERYLQQQQRTPFEYGQPLLRMAIVGGGGGAVDADRFFVLSAHHACYDGWSQRLVWEDVARAYNGAGVAPAQPFQSFVRKIKLTSREASESFWRDALADRADDDDNSAVTFPAVPAGHRPVAREKLSHRCRRLPQKPAHLPGVTVSTLLNAAWAIVLAQYGGAPTVSFGATVSGREVALPGIEGIVGPTISTVPRKVMVRGEQSVADFLQYVHAAVVVASISHAHLALDHIMRLSPAARRACNFGSLLTVQPRSAVLGSAHEAIGLQALPVDSSSFHPHPLAVDCWVGAGEDEGMELELHFDPDCISADVVGGMARQLDHVLQNLCAAKPSAPVKSAMALHAEDLSRILAWADRIPAPVEACAHHAIEANAAHHPHREALVTSERVWTYAELDRQATQLARRLVNTGLVGPDQFVGVCFEKTGFAVVAMLAVWKAGGAYVPLNPAHPVPRLHSLLGRAGARIVLCSSTAHSALEGAESYVAIRVDEACFRESADEDQSVSLPVSHAGHAAYMIFTSGSTGEPKGVVMEHRALCSSMAGMKATVPLGPEVRMLQYASFTFDVSIQELILTLAAGACVCMPSDSERANDVAAFVRATGVNAINLTPSVLRLLRPADVPAVRLVICGGEALAQSDVETWASVPGLRLVNEYGPTEVCISITRMTMAPGTKASIIGKPTAALPWVVSPVSGSLAAIGAVGELYLQGSTLARGYHGDLERTAEAFLRDPAWLPAGFGGRVYRTGDMVCRNGDGTLTFLGRRDGQVKIRGQRVETGEVAERVRKCMVEVCCDQDGGLSFSNAAVELYRPADDSGREPFLVALLSIDGLPEDQTGNGLVVMHSSKDVRLVAAAESIKQALRSVLPAYMVPPAFIAVRTLPITPSGKLNRRLIHDLLEELERRGSPLLGARTDGKGETRKLSEEEEALRQGWAEVLGLDVEAISLGDGFFDLGGSSVTAIRLVSMMRSRGLGLKYEAIVTAQRLDEMALCIAPLRGGRDELPVPRPFELLPPGQRDQVVRELLPRYGIDAALVQDVYPCTPLQESLIAATVRDREAYVSFQAIQVPSSSKAKFEEAWHAVTNRFELLRTRIVPGLDNGSALQVVMQPQGIPPPWLHVPDVPDFISDVYATPCHGGQLVHTAWIKPVDGESPAISAVIAAHHALYDGWSMNMIWKALAAELAGNPAPAPTPYSAFVGHLTQQEDEAAVRHWRARLAGADCPPFPHNPPPAGYQPAASSTQETCVELGVRAGAGMASLARAAWGLVLAHYTGSADLAFGSIVSGRENGLQAVGGPTMAAVPVRVRLDSIDAGATVDALLSRVASEAAQDIPFAQVGMHRIARISSDARRACGFETLLVVQPPDSEEQESMVRPEPLSRPRIFPHVVIVEVAPSSDARRAALSLAYDPLLLPDVLAGRVLDTFAALLARLSDPANGRLQQAALQAISPRDLKDLRESTRASPIVTVDSCAHDLLHGPTRCSPGATAIEAWDGSLSYEQVDMLSSSLAAHLVDMGVRPERAVPLLFDKSKWVPVAMLAVWKAGGYWVPLDAGWPLSRLRTVVAAVDAAVVLSSSGNRSMAEAAVPSTPDRVVVVEDGAQSVCSAARTTVCHGQIASPSNLAYVMFTSGSTGTPKGVMIQHRALSSSIVALRVSHGIDSASRVLHSASYSFDASLCEIFVVLSAGGTVCIPSERARLDDLCGYIRIARVSHAFCTPSVSRLLDPGSLPDLRALFLGGEPMLDADKQRWCGRVFLTNGFGPTETCIACAMQPLTQPETSARSIGKSLQNCRLWVAASLHDQCDQLAPIGAIGELCVEGPSVATGYLNDTEKTAAAMMPAPPADWIGDDEKGMVERFRVYRTGDLVRYDEHGCLRFVGRRDALQVKIRGQRLELGDVENAVRRILLDEDSGDNESRGTGAAVDVFESARGTQMLLAVLAIGDAYQEVDARPHPHTVRLMRSLSTMLHSRLAALLPTHMLPGGYVPVKELPLNAAGKLDRRALKAHISALSLDGLRTFSADPENDAIAAALPQSEEEMLMARLWRKVLGLTDDAQLSCGDTFFRLGGDSILAMRLAAEARSHGFQLAVRDVFAQPTLGGAAGCMKRVREESKNTTVPAQQEDKKDGGDEVLRKVRDEYPGLALAPQETAPCTPMQVAMMQKMHIVRFVFSMDPGFDPARFQAAIERCATVLTILRTRVVEADGVLHQVVASSAPPWRFAGGSLEEAMDEEASIPTSVGDPLIRFTVVGHGSHLIWTQHHATYDAWSMRLLLEHVARAYADPTYHPLEPLPFLTFARRLHGSGRDPSSTATFWSSYFADATPTPQLFGYAS